MSPYIESRNRLGDVIAAVQAMGTYKYYKLDFAGWSDRISGDETKAEYWKKVFEEHPEFFRLDSKKERASLVWRRQHQKLYDVDKEERITRSEYLQLTDEQKTRISRIPLSSGALTALIQTAIDMHSRAMDFKKDSRWWVTGLIGLAGVILGAVIRACAG